MKKINTGNVLLSRTSLPWSTIGAIELNFRVRDGNGCGLYAIVTGKLFLEINVYGINQLKHKSYKNYWKSLRKISTTWLNTLLYLHL